ncbi:Acidic endochitinase SP2 [Smittium mucronatum]|uniref:Acidic endochitinase SP2 n=1 Tax=Smittium mucronatum TaxID=133383 RepID=A0A1R0GZ31_9FUNG|nr:Acidic endochitinase SP2 [Smittium mucronatum]
MHYSIKNLAILASVLSSLTIFSINAIPIANKDGLINKRQQDNNPTSRSNSQKWQEDRKTKTFGDSPRSSPTAAADTANADTANANADAASSSIPPTNDAPTSTSTAPSSSAPAGTPDPSLNDNPDNNSGDSTTQDNVKKDTSSGNGSSGGVDCAKFNSAVTSAGYAQPSADKCQAFLSGFGIGGISSPTEAAMFLSEILWESDGLSTKEEYYCQTNDCKAAYASNTDVSGKVYFGRGYIQLTWSSNYLAASKGIYGDDRLLKNPELVSASEEASWAVSFWFWKAIVKTNADVAKFHFGAATNMINGALECRGAYGDKARKRFEIYKKVLAVFAPGTTPIESGCYN